jgi:cytochrome b
MKTVRVWDAPVRLFHWLLVLSIIGLFITGKLGGNWMEWHARIGYCVIGLILFRLIWGFAGGYHARFVNFVRGPAAVLAYARSLAKSQSQASIGHNPLGALSVLAMLTVIGLQASFGLFADDEILMSGPLASSVSSATSALLTKLHRLNSYVILALVATHLAAIGFYWFVKRENLVKPMITGKKELDAER